jgi:hypothetical protein
MCMCMSERLEYCRAGYVGSTQSNSILAQIHDTPQTPAVLKRQNCTLIVMYVL